MVLQFYCPQGHLLEGPESLAGQTCSCPHCNSEFVVPGAVQALPVAPAAAAYPEENLGMFDHGPPAEDQMFDQLAGAPAAGGASVFEEPAPAPAQPAVAVTQEEDPHRICRLICPCQRALELPTPKSMMGTDALCPYCGVQFQLKYEDTIEYKEERDHARAVREQMLGKRWLKWAYIVAAIVGICLLGMIIFNAMN